MEKDVAAVVEHSETSVINAINYTITFRGGKIFESLSDHEKGMESD